MKKTEKTELEKKKLASYLGAGAAVVLPCIGSVAATCFCFACFENSIKGIVVAAMHAFLYILGGLFIMEASNTLFKRVVKEEQLEKEKHLEIQQKEGEDNGKN